ncbi:MAG: hypothetical protein KDB53_21860 [Planctomycetes bacterium]|nr:hypothetical protein [Planctomycetota bacterium]
MASLLAIALIVHPPVWLEALRLPLGLAISWPWRSLEARFRSPPETTREADPVLDLWDAYLRALPDGSRAVAVVHRDRRDRFLVAAAGVLHGVRRGCFVSSRGRLIGQVDSVRTHLCRIRLATDPRLAFGASVELAASELPLRLLLRGDGDSLAVPTDGCRLPPEALGLVARLAGTGGAADGLLLGDVRQVARRDGPAVVFDLGLDAIQRVRIHDSVTGEPVVPPLEAIFDSLSAEVALARGAAGVQGGWWITTEGKTLPRRGAWISRRRRLIGRVEDVWNDLARGRPAPMDGLSAVRFSDRGALREEGRYRDLQSSEPGGHLFSTGVADRAALPPGLVISETALPALERHESVVVHVFRFEDELDDLRGVARR